MRGSAILLALALLPGRAIAACDEDMLDLRWSGGTAHFEVEIADDPAERATGLMHRATMPSSSGMLFVYDSPRMVSFWMKDTLIPLDMLFIDARGVVRAIRENAVPQDLTPIPSGQEVQFVLEVNGGLSARLGIEPGAEMRYLLIDPAQAAWLCDAP